RSLFLPTGEIDLSFRARPPSPKNARTRKSARKGPLHPLFESSELYRSDGDGRGTAVAPVSRYLCAGHERHLRQRILATTGAMASRGGPRSGREPGVRHACRSFWPQPGTHSRSVSRGRTHRRRQPESIPQGRRDPLDSHASSDCPDRERGRVRATDVRVESQSRGDVARIERQRIARKRTERKRRARKKLEPAGIRIEEFGAARNRTSLTLSSRGFMRPRP